MSIRVGINGFGRMGRLGVRAGWGWDGIDLVQVNETACDAAGSAHLLKFDSVHGTWDRACAGEGGELKIDGCTLAYSSNQGIGETDWSGCDLVIEATGKHHKKPETLQAYFDQGVKKVLVAAPPKARSILSTASTIICTIPGAHRSSPRRPARPTAWPR